MGRDRAVEARVAALAVGVALILALGSPLGGRGAALAQDGETAAPAGDSLENEARAAWGKLQRSAQRHNRLAEKARTDPGLKDLMSATARGFLASRARFRKAFAASDWDKLEATADRPMLLSGLSLVGAEAMSSEPATALRAYECLLAHGATGSAGRRAAIEIPAALVAMGEFERAIERSAELDASVDPVTRARMSVYRGDVHAALGDADAARSAYEAAVKVLADNERPPDPEGAATTEGSDGTVDEPAGSPGGPPGTGPGKGAHGPVPVPGGDGDGDEEDEAERRDAYAWQWSRWNESARGRLALLGETPTIPPDAVWVGGEAHAGPVAGAAALTFVESTACAACRMTLAQFVLRQAERKNEGLAVYVMTRVSKTGVLPGARGDIRAGQVVQMRNEAEFVAHIGQVRRKLEAQYPVIVLNGDAGDSPFEMLGHTICVTDRDGKVAGFAWSGAHEQHADGGIAMRPPEAALADKLFERVLARTE